jgi:hypothetical protein
MPRPHPDNPGANRWSRFTTRSISEFSAIASTQSNADRAAGDSAPVLELRSPDGVDVLLEEFFRQDSRGRTSGLEIHEPDDFFGSAAARFRGLSGSTPSVANRNGAALFSGVTPADRSLRHAAS